MITLEGPHMALNDSRAVNRLIMTRNMPVVPTTERVPIIENVARNARQMRQGKFRNVVFNCHGLPSSLEMGVGFNRSHAILFMNWRGLVDKIWFYSCETGGTVTPGAAFVGDGRAFCSEVAQFAQCHVVAFTEDQAISERGHLPFGQLDTPEGLVQSYDPNGNVTWSHRYPSTYTRANGTSFRNRD